MLACVGACLIMIVSSFGFADILDHSHVILAPSRVAAQVVSGTGFLGAGSTLLRGDVVKGLTTAASLWTVAAIGLAVAGGLHLAAMVATIIILVILAGTKQLEEWLQRHSHTHEIISRRTGDAEDGNEIHITLRRVPPALASDLIARLKLMPGIKEVGQSSPAKQLTLF